jgi:ABC-type sugar transport system permease subunit
MASAPAISIKASEGSRPRPAEIALGYLFIAPALIITFIFGLFPVILGFVISMQDGTLVPTGFVGFRNYLIALGSIAYLLAIALALVLAIGGYYAFRVPYREMQVGKGNFYPYLLPGTLAALATLLLLGTIFGDLLGFVWFPIVLLILALGGYFYLQAQQLRPASYVIDTWLTMLLTFSSVFLLVLIFHELDVISTPYLAALSQVVRFGKYIMPLNQQFAALFLAAISAGAFILVQSIRQNIDSDEQPGRALLFSILRLIALIFTILPIVFVIGGQALLQGTLNAFDPTKLSTVTSLKPEAFLAEIMLWPQVFTTLLGSALIGAAFLLWMNASRRQTTPGMLGTLGTAILLMIGGWLFISELPQAAGGDPAFYQGLLRTLTYAALTVPLQLGIGLLLAYLLFYEVKWGKSFYRIVFFIPYIAPVAATAAVFAVIFSLRDTSPANQLVHLFGIPQQKWLIEQRGIFQIIAQLIGGARTQLPDILAGPSLPLLIAILFAIWVYSGYDAVIFLAGLGAVPRELLEASQVDGATRWTIFRYIIFPLISPTTFFLSILAIIGTIKALDSIYVLRDSNGRGAMDTATVYIFEQIRNGQRPYAAALGFVVFGIILILTLVQNRLSQDQVFYG